MVAQDTYNNNYDDDDNNMSKIMQSFFPPVGFFLYSV